MKNKINYKSKLKYIIIISLLIIIIIIIKENQKLSVSNIKKLGSQVSTLT